MNRKLINSALLLTLCGACLVGCTSGGRKKGGGRSEDIYKDHYTNKKDIYGNTVADYNLLTTEGEELQTNIHHYLIDQHKTYLRYAQIIKYYTYTEQLDGTTGYENFYTGWIHRDNTVTREHMWCCADSNGMWYRNSKQKEWKMDDQKPGGEEQYWGGGSDIYQLRACTYEVNSHRSNYRYYVFTDNDYDTATDEGAPYALKYNDSKKVCEVDDYFKGDVARTLLYLYCHYNSYDDYDVYYNTSHYPTYNIDEAVAETATSTPYVCAPRLANGDKYLHFSLIMNYDETECIRRLKEWNRIDPPSDLERQRNRYIESGIQGNRNPFIDFPELVDKCFPDIN